MMLDKRICGWCDEPIEPDELAAAMAISFGCWHRECVLRSISGGVNHQRGLCHCCGGDADPDPPGLTKRQAAIAAVEEWQNRKELDDAV